MAKYRLRTDTMHPHIYVYEWNSAAEPVKYASPGDVITLSVEEGTRQQNAGVPLERVDNDETTANADNKDK